MIDLFRVRWDDDAVNASFMRATKADEQGRRYIGQGKLCEEFERQFGELVGAPEPVLLLNSCTSAIDLALHLIGVGPGDEVITTPITCTATNSPPALRGARIVWADVDPLTGNIDPNDVYKKVTPKTKAVIGVNWGGRRADYYRLSLAAPMAEIIEDAAHGPYTAPEWAEYTCYSFQAIKHLTMGDGGALRCADPDQTKRAKLLRWYGLDRESSADFRCAQNIQEIGYKYQSNDIAAAIGLANLPGMAAAVERGRTNAEYYAHWLRDTPGIEVPPFDPGCAYWLFTILCDDRDDFSAYLGERGIATSQVHARNDKHDAFKKVSTLGDAMATSFGNVDHRYLPDAHLPGVDAFDARQVSIPNGFWVTDEQREYIAKVVVEWAMKRARRAA